MVLAAPLGDRLCGCCLCCQDKYTIIIQSTFETFVPAPVVEVSSLFVALGSRASLLRRPLLGEPFPDLLLRPARFELDQIDPPFFDFNALRAENPGILYFNITNHGLIAAHQVRSVDSALP